VNHTTKTYEAATVVQIAQKFELFLEAYRRPDGSRWGGQDLHDATGGVVTRSYVTNLRKGRIESPGHDKMAALAKAVGFAPALWFDYGEEAADTDPDWELVAALKDETVREITRESSRLAAREARMVLGIVRQVRDAAAGTASKKRGTR
jgi:transcriptional regulator with XRE-family HTH domain